MPSAAEALDDLRALVVTSDDKTAKVSRTHIVWLEDAVAAYEAFHDAYREVAKNPVGSPAYCRALERLVETKTNLAKILGRGRPNA